MIDGSLSELKKFCREFFLKNGKPKKGKYFEACIFGNSKKMITASVVSLKEDRMGRVVIKTVKEEHVIPDQDTRVSRGGDNITIIRSMTCNSDGGTSITIKRIPENAPQKEKSTGK